MTRKATTIRLAPDTQSALTRLSEILHRPMNQLVNEAVREFVARRGREVASELESTLARLRELHAQDPEYEAASDAWVKAELTHEDPIDGELWLEPATSSKVLPPAR